MKTSETIEEKRHNIQNQYTNCVDNVVNKI